MIIGLLIAWLAFTNKIDGEDYPGFMMAVLVEIMLEMALIGAIFGSSGA